VTSFVIEHDKPIEWLSFARAMETLIALRGADLLRIKGILNVAGCRGPVVVQYVQHLAHPPVELETWPDQNRNGRVVFITRNISQQNIRDLFSAVQALA
jgi:G3E family GTPase